jgi:hypothetical protein
MYCSGKGASVKPNVLRRSAIDSGVSLVLKRANSAAAGSPGMSRGITNASVTDAHTATR